MIDYDWLANRIETAKKLNGVVDEQDMENLFQAYILTGDESIKQTIDNLQRMHEEKLLLSNELYEKLPSEELGQGDIKLGNAFQGSVLKPVFIKKSDLLRHMAIYAQTGHAKSTLLYHLMQQFIEQRIPFLFFDRKRDGRALLRLYPEVIVIPWQKLKWNPLRSPPKVPVKQFWQVFSEICGHSWGVYHAGINYLLEWLSEFRETCEKTGRYPTLIQLRDAMKNKTEYSRKKDEYYQVMWNRVRSLTEVLENVVCVEDGLHIEDLLDKPVVIELDGLRVEEQNWLIAVMLSYIYAYRMSEGHRGEE